MLLAKCDSPCDDRQRNLHAGLSNPADKTEGPLLIGRALGGVVCVMKGYHFMGLCAIKTEPGSMVVRRCNLRESTFSLKMSIAPVEIVFFAG